MPSESAGFRRHLEGWQVGALAVGIALTAAALVVPRHTPTAELPAPRVDRAQQRRERVEMHQRADRAEQNPLPYEIRAVGELVRRFGIANVDGDAAQLAAIREDLKRTIPLAVAKHGDDPLLVLRAVQTRMFLAAVRRWEATATQSADLTELGGNFAQKAAETRWTDDRGRLVLDDDELAASFRVRWGQVTGLLARHPFAPSLNDWRVYYGSRLDHPEAARNASRATVIAAQRTYVDGLERYDPDYPALFARGILDLRARRYGSAVRWLSAHLEANPHGRWRLRARNSLATALERTR